MTEEMQQASRIWSEVDLDRSGKQVGVLHLPYSVTRSGYGMIDIPIAVIRNGEGPSVLLMAGNHGDEYEGQVTLSRLIHDIETSDIAGRLIILPAANLPAAMAGARVSPLDSGNLNRAFPGRGDGSPTWQIAHYIDSVLLPICSAWIDLHSGGGSMDYLPFAAFYESGEAELDAQGEAMMRAFGAPRSVRVTARPDSRLAAATAHRHKIPYLGGEWGGGGSVDPGGVALTRHGVLRVLAHLGVLRRSERFGLSPLGQTQHLAWGGYEYYAFAPEAGLFEPAVRLGERIADGQLCGHVHFIESPWRAALPVHFKKGGLLVCQRHFGRVLPGDCVAHTMIEAA
jgi:predicted deacylase